MEHSAPSYGIRRRELPGKLLATMARAHDPEPRRPFAIREMDRAVDRRRVAAIDTSFRTTSVFDVLVAPRRIELVERTLTAPLIKRYPMEDVFAPWATWETGFVADDGAICGFAAVEHEVWHRRLVLWHLYVAPRRNVEVPE